MLKSAMTAIALALLASCSSPAVVQCKVAAVRFLPEDPGQITPYDVVDLVKRLHECKGLGDAGR
jgi:hypothetical protein